MLGYHHPPRKGGTPWEGGTPQEQTPPWEGAPPQKEAPPQEQTPPGKQTLAYGQRAAGTHPTGMHSCLLKMFSIYGLIFTQWAKPTFCQTYDGIQKG